MHGLYNVKEMLLEELEKHGDEQKLTGENLKEIDTLAHALKNVCKVIESCDDDEYSGRYYESRARHRDAMGRFSRDAEPMDRGSYRMSRGSYGNKENVVEQLEQLMINASDDRTRGKFRELIRDMRNG